ncbi:MAG: alpha/beta hydrolase [Aliishimia sp.]
MDLSEAPLFTDASPGPADGAAWWMQTQDGVQIRAGAWGRDATKGTVLLFPGRTEYIEKYGVTAQELADRGYATVTLDWRGQGLADRSLPDRRVGNVGHFNEFQQDVASMMRLVQKLDLPKPYYLLGHSMGGCIGLRSLVDGLDVQAAAFTGPMWGIRIAPHLVIPAWILAHVMPMIGLGGKTPPGTRIDPYVLAEPFEDNQLTRFREMWDMMRNQLIAHPDLGLGAPSYIWLREALHETGALARRSSPAQPCVTYLGTNERIVNTQRIHDRMSRWPNGRLEMVSGGEHEVQLEDPDTRKWLFDDMCAHFENATG